MDAVKHAYWASVKFNGDFYCVDTYSGYRMYQLDFKGIQNLLPKETTNSELGQAIIKSQNASRFALPEPRKDVLIPKEIEFDMDLFDYDKYNKCYKAWVEGLMNYMGYKTKKKLFMYMHSCGVVRRDGQIICMPTIDDKEHCQAFEMKSELNITISDTSTPEQIGAAVRLAFNNVM